MKKSNVFLLGIVVVALLSGYSGVSGAIHSASGLQDGKSLISFSGSSAGIQKHVSGTIVKSMSSGTTSSAKYILLIHGYSWTGGSESGIWSNGVNIYSQLVQQGYVVGVVSYYGEFQISFSNGYTYSDPGFYGTQNTPIESISSELGNAMESIFTSPVNMNVVAYSMGGLVFLGTLENYNFPNIHLGNVIFLATPFDGTPIASLASYIDIVTGYQTDEMSPGSSYLTTLQDNTYLAVSNNPQTTWIVYAGNYDPWWGYLVFNGDNDGVVSVNSATYLGYNYFYLFSDLHTSSLDSLTLSGISYFHDQNVANTLIANFEGYY